MNRGKRWRRPRLDVPEAIGVVIDRSGEDRFASTRAPIAEHAWRRAVGARIADRAKPISLENGVLVVKVATSAWAHELSLMKVDLLRPLATHGVKDIRFKVGTIEAPRQPTEQRKSRAVPTPAVITGELAANIAKVEDPELRELIAIAAGSSIAWQEHTQQNKKPPRKR